MIQNQVAVRELQTLGGEPLTIPMNGNLSFAQGAVEQLAGDSNLISVRSRASRERPFTVVQKMQADAESNYRSKIKELETSLSETQRKVNELQRSKDAGQRFILSPEQQQELTNFRKTEADVKTQLKEMRRKLRAGNRLAGEPDQVDQYRGNADCCSSGWICFRPDEAADGAGMKRNQLVLILVLLDRSRRRRPFSAQPQLRYLEQQRDRIEREDSLLSRSMMFRASRSRRAKQNSTWLRKRAVGV